MTQPQLVRRRRGPRRAQLTAPRALVEVLVARVDLEVELEDGALRAQPHRLRQRRGAVRRPQRVLQHVPAARVSDDDDVEGLEGRSGDECARATWAPCLRRAQLV
jgi:hypothetical protein